MTSRSVSFLCLFVAAIFLAALAAGIHWNWHPWNASISLKRVSGEAWSHDDFLACYQWWAAAGNAILFTFLGLTTRLWFGKSGVQTSGFHEELDTRINKIWWLVAIGAVAVAAWIAWPRLSQSMWDDEQHTMLTFVNGQWMRELDADGKVTTFFGQPSWIDTIFGYHDPNNHFLFSILARLSLNAWRGMHDLPAYEFSEVAFRLPAFVFGLLAIPLWGWFARVVGLRAGALILMVLLAIHPWFVRYISEGRGYALMLAGLPLVLGSATLAVRFGKWKWWLLFSLTQIFTLLSWPGAALPILLLNLAIASSIWRKGKVSRTALGFAWGAANLISLGLFFQWFLPCLFQELNAGFEWPGGVMGCRYPLNFLSHLSLGTVWSSPDFTPLHETRFLPIGRQELAGLAGSVSVMSCVCLVAIIGIWKLWHPKSESSEILQPLLIAWFGGLAVLLPLAIWASQAGKMLFLFDWYFIWVLPVLLLMASHGLEKISVSTEGRIQRIPPPALPFIFVLVFAFHSAPFLQRLRRFPVQPMRESVLAMRSSTALQAKDANAVLTGHVNQMAISYDPHGWEVTELETNDPVDLGLRDLMKLAEETKRPLYLDVGFPRAARLNFPEIMQVVDQPALFEVVSQFQGQELTLDHVVFLYRGGVRGSKD